MFRVPAFFAALSEVLSAALEAVGVNPIIVARRRDTYLYREIAKTVRSQQNEPDSTSYHFGSMSEGTTTLGMNSNTDELFTQNDYNIMYTLTDWKRGKENFLMIKDRTTPAQYYMLQEFRPDLPLPVDYTDTPSHRVTDEHGRVFLSNRVVHDNCAELFGHDYIRRGPSHSTHKDFIFVLALRCSHFPPEILSWFNRPRLINWIPQAVMDAARRCPFFLVPDGHHASEKKDIEWRITPNLIERLLMFSLNIIQVQCLVVLKMLKNQELGKYISHEGCKITTFHLKTVLLFTLDRTPTEKWTKPHLVECIVLCLNTLIDFLLGGGCPHYIIEGADLFDGKLCRACQVRLGEAVRAMIQDDMKILFGIQSDDLGQRMMNLSRETQAGPGENMNARICGKLVHDVFLEEQLYRLIKICYKVCSGVEADFETRLDNKIFQLQRLAIEERDDRAIFFIRFLIKNLVSTKASVVSSRYIQTGQSIPREVWTLYGESMHTDVTSSKLKLASMLYCRGELWRAASVLNEVEFEFDMSVQPACGCRIRPHNKDLSGAFCESMLENDNLEMWTKKLAFCVRFLREERFCAPLFLWYEMCRGTEDEIDYRSHQERQWMNWAEVDARPFLFYLEYLTFRALGVRNRQQEALTCLRYIVQSNEMNKLYHPETFHNLLGHCLELEGNVEGAQAVYEFSRLIRTRNNAANHHIARLEGR